MQKTMKIVLSSLAVLAFAGLLLFLGGDMCADDSSADPAMAGMCSATNADEVYWELINYNETWDSYQLNLYGSGAMKDYTEVMSDTSDQPWSAFRGQIGSVKVGPYITHIGDYAFAGITKSYSPGKRIQIDSYSELTSIGSHAFSDCRLFRNISQTDWMPGKVVTIGDYAFSGVSLDDYRDFTIPDTTTTIGDHAFDTLGADFHIGSGITKIGASAMKVHNVDFKGAIPTDIGANAFIQYNDYFPVVIMGVSAEGITGDKLAEIAGTKSMLVTYDPIKLEAKILGATHDKSVAKIGPTWSYDGAVPWKGMPVNKIEYSGIDQIYYQDIDAMMALSVTGSYQGVKNYPESLIIDGVEQIVTINAAKGILGFTDPDGHVRPLKIAADVTEIVPEDLPGITYYVINGQYFPNVKSITVPSTAEAVYIENFTGLEYLKIDATIEKNPSMVTRAGQNASTPGLFNNLQKLKVFDVSGMTNWNIDRIPSSVVEVKLPATKTDIGGMFNGCRNLTTVNTENIKIVGDNGFNNCSSLTTLDLSNVESIGNGAFSGCTSLVSITLTDKCTSIGSGAFSNTALTSFTIPKEVTVTENIWSGSPISEIVLSAQYSGENTIENGVLFCDDGETLVFVPASFTFYEVKDGVKNIAYRAMAGGSLMNVVIPASVVTVGDNVFENSAVESVYFQETENDRTINSRAFMNAGKLVAVYVVGENDNNLLADNYYAGRKVVSVTGGADQFAVSFNTNGGNDIDPILFDVYITAETAMPQPVKVGSVFCGWYFDAGLSSYAGDSIPQGLIGNKTYYARWALPTDFVSGASVIAFSGSSAVIRIDSDAVPSGELIVRYSEYIDLAEGKILFPFMTGTVSVTAGTDTVAFTNDDGKAIESVSVTFRYNIGAVPFYTPLSYANAPATAAKADLTIDSGLSLKFDQQNIVNGTEIDYGYYAAEVTGGQTVVINGQVWRNGDKFFYCGQKLVVSKVA